MPSPKVLEAAKKLSDAWEAYQSARNQAEALGDDSTIYEGSERVDVLKTLWAERKTEIDLAHAQEAFQAAKAS